MSRCVFCHEHVSAIYSTCAQCDIPLERYAATIAEVCAREAEHVSNFGAPFGREAPAIRAIPPEELLRRAEAVLAEKAKEGT